VSAALAGAADAVAAEGTAPAPTWVLLRGLTREAAHWGDFPARLAAALPAGARVITLDLPGNGALRDRPSPARVEDMAKACRAELRSLQAPAPINLVAMSLGAMVAVAWASRHPQEIGRAVLINTSLRPFSPPHQRLRPANWPRLIGLLRPGVAPREVEATILRMTSARDGGAEPLPAAAQALAPRSQAERDALLDHWTAIRRERPVAPADALRQLLAAARYRAPLAAPAVPLLLLVGARDVLVDPRCSRRLAAAWGVELREHPAAGHDLPLDAPDWVARQIAG